MTTNDLELMNKMHKLCHKAAVGYTIDFEQSVGTYGIKIKSVCLTERYHTKLYESIGRAFEEAITHLEKIAFPNHDPSLHVVM